MRRLRVWIVTPELHRLGGTERCLAEQVERWKDRFDLRLYTMRTVGVDLQGIAVRRIPWLPGPHLLRYIWWFVTNTVVRAWDARRLGAPDVVHSPGINCPDAEAVSVHIVFEKYWERVRAGVMKDLFSWQLALRTAHRIVYWTLIRRLERWAYAGPATIWALSSTDARELEVRYRRPARSVPVVPHGVDTERFSPKLRMNRRDLVRERLGVSGKRVLLLIGNDAYNKGVDTAVRSLAYLPEDVVLAVAGLVDGELVRSWALQAGVPKRVLIWPHTPEVLDYYAAADVLVHPSRTDAFPNPPMEALACGLPVLLSVRNGLSELLQDGRHALLLENSEDPAACGHLVHRVLHDPELAEHLSREGRALAEQHSWDDNAARAAALIEREATTPRVLVLAPHAWGTGGIERATRTLLRALADRYGPERVALLSVWGGTSPLPCRVLWKGPALRGSARVPVWLKLRFVLAALVAARRWRRRLVVVACHPHLAPAARLCARAARAPYLVWCHGEEVWRPQRVWVRRALRAARTVIAPSRFTASMVQQTAGVDEERLVVLPHAVPSEVPLPGDATAAQAPGRTVLSVARLAPEHAYKGVDMLIAAWPRVVEAVPGAELVIVGDGPDRPRLEAEARRLGLDGRIQFAGALDDAALGRAYAAAAVFALPARTTVGDRSGGEGFGLVYLEAAAAGLPVVAGNGGGIPEVVVHGETGLLVDPRSPEAVGEAVVTLLRDPALARAMGAAARRRALQEFSYERFRDGLCDLVARARALP